jgi:DNA-binding MarR family transcriptional regulator
VTTTKSLLLAWRNLYLANAFVSEALNARLQAEAGCTLLEHDLMAWLAAAPERRLRMLELARRLRITPGGLTRVVDRLVERTWIERDRPESNRRIVYAVLTDRGTATLAAARSSYVRVLRGTLGKRLGDPELQALGGAAEKLLQPDIGS